MLKGLLCAALAALTLTLAAPLAQGVPDPNGIEFPEGYYGDEDGDFSVKVPDEEDGDPDEGAYGIPELMPGEDGWGWVIRVGPEIHFVGENDGYGYDVAVPEAWGDTFEWVSYCYEFGGLDAICGG